jgi:hypothetical protein
VPVGISGKSTSFFSTAEYERRMLVGGKDTPLSFLYSLRTRYFLSRVFPRILDYLATNS